MPGNCSSKKWRTSFDRLKLRLRGLRCRAPRVSAFTATNAPDRWCWTCDAALTLRRRLCRLWPGGSHARAANRSNTRRGRISVTRRLVRSRAAVTAFGANIPRHWNCRDRYHWLRASTLRGLLAASSSTLEWLFLCPNGGGNRFPANHAPYSPNEITIYSLRPSSIARQILRGVPIRVVAVMHDTSVAMIEKNYSALLADHSDAITRAALIELA